MSYALQSTYLRSKQEICGQQKMGVWEALDLVKSDMIKISDVASNEHLTTLYATRDEKNVAMVSSFTEQDLYMVRWFDLETNERFQVDCIELHRNHVADTMEEFRFAPIKSFIAREMANRQPV